LTSPIIEIYLSGKASVGTTTMISKEVVWNVGRVWRKPACLS